jgi:hypothetical protein
MALNEIYHAVVMIACDDGGGGGLPALHLLISLYGNKRKIVIDCEICTHVELFISLLRQTRRDTQ